MFEGRKITVVIPTLNEAQGIQRTIESIPSIVDEILVVDGNSTDGTQEVATKNGARVIVEKRRGYGLAFKTGFLHATGDIIATTDGDGTYPIELLPDVLQHMKTNSLKFVSCSRFPLQDRSSMRKRNWIGNVGMTKVASFLWMHPFLDILSGMWVFEKSSLAKLTLLSDSWNLSEEIKLQAYMVLGPAFGEYGIPYRERLGETKLVPWKVGLENLAYLAMMRSGTLGFFRDVLKKPRAVDLLK